MTMTFCNFCTYPAYKHFEKVNFNTSQCDYKVVEGNENSEQRCIGLCNKLSCFAVGYQEHGSDPGWCCTFSEDMFALDVKYNPGNYSIYHRWKHFYHSVEWSPSLEFLCTFISRLGAGSRMRNSIMSKAYKATSRASAWMWSKYFAYACATYSPRAFCRPTEGKEGCWKAPDVKCRYSLAPPPTVIAW